jgi:hypothetical protein
MIRTIIVSSVALGGCASSTATILRAHDAPPITEAHIVSSDSKNVYVEQDMLDGHVEKTVVPRREIVTIYHPGIETTYLGGALVVLGGVSMVYGFAKGGSGPTCNPCVDKAWVATGAVGTAFGVFALVMGEIVRHKSVTASEPEHTGIQLMPTGLGGRF